MKQIWQIYKNDLKKIITNWAALLVILALCIIPSLYAWFNIKASWDPYSPEATKGIKVAVVNQDSGSTFNNKQINIGDEVVATLKENDSLGWEFLDEQTAQEKLTNEQVYAVIKIPENFTKELISVTTNNVEQPTIEYTVNEKINAIAPKITIKGAETIQSSVSSVIVDAISKTVLTAAKEVGLNIESALPLLNDVFTSVIDLQSNFGELNTLVNTAGVETKDVENLLIKIQQQLPAVGTTLANSEQLLTEIQSFIDTTNVEIDNITPMITSNLDLIISLSSSTSNDITNLINLINSNIEQAPEQINLIINKLTTLKDLNSSLIQFLTALDLINPSDKIKEFINQLSTINTSIEEVTTILNQVKTDIESGNTPDLTKLENLKTLANNITSSAQSVKNYYVNNLEPQLKDILANAFGVAASSVTIIGNARNQLPQVTKIVDQAIIISQSGGDVVAYLQENLPVFEEFVNHSVSEYERIKDSGIMEQVLNLITNSVNQRAAFLSHPIQLEETSIFEMGNYGSAMTPFYTVLSLWVGITLLVSMLRVDASKSNPSWVNYFGKLLLFITLALIQALIVSLGDILILGIHCTSPLLFIGFMLFTAVVFATIIYSLVSVFGNFGKVIVIVLLVLQVAASGGTYPVELMSNFFKTIHSFLPFSYAISLARQAIGGSVLFIVRNDIIILALYTLIMLLIGVILKPYINKLLEPFNEKLHSSGLTTEGE